MPRRSTRKRKTPAAVSSADSDDQVGASKGGKRKQAAPPVRQTAPLATLLTPDALGRSLSFLDVPSLVRSEMAAKFVQGAAAGVWAALDRKIGVDKKADGDSPRDRVIRSCPLYRHHLQRSIQPSQLP